MASLKAARVKKYRQRLFRDAKCWQAIVRIAVSTREGREMILAAEREAALEIESKKETTNE